MASAGERPEPAGVDQDTSLAPYANLLKFGFFNATTWMISQGTPLVLLAGQLGASSFEVGLAYSFVFLLLPVQILATAALPRFGYKRQVIFGWASRGIFLVIPLYLAILAPAHPERWMVHALVASTFLFSLFRSMGSCGVMPLIYSVLPEHVRGKYFSTDQAVTGISGILTLLMCSLLFRFLPIYDAFFWQYLYAIAGVFFTVYYLARVKDPPRPKATSLREIAAETPAICLRPAPFRQFMIFMIAYSLMSTAFVPLKAYYLKVQAGLPADLILVYTAIQYAGAIISTLFLRHHVDRLGVKPLFRISLALSFCISVFWYFVVSGHAQLLMALPLAYFAFGVAASQWITAHLKYLPRVCDEEKQALHVSVHSSVIGVLGGLAPIIWGYLVKMPGTLPGVRADRFALYFVMLMVVQLGLLLYTSRLTSEHSERPALETSAGLLRPFRFVGQLINFLPPNGPKRPPAGED